MEPGTHPFIFSDSRYSFTCSQEISTFSCTVWIVAYHLHPHFAGNKLNNLWAALSVGSLAVRDKLNNLFPKPVGIFPPCPHSQDDVPWVWLGEEKKGAKKKAGQKALRPALIFAPKHRKIACAERILVV